MPDLHVFPNTDALAEAAAEEIAARLTEAIATRGQALLVLTGGATPKPVYERLAAEHGDAIDWSRVHVFWGDDRFVPHDHPESNVRLAEEHLLHRVPVPDAQRHPFPTTGDPDEAALAFEQYLRRLFDDTIPAWDVLLLGLGDDLHIGSIWPDTDAAFASDRWVLHTTSPPDQPVTDRLTMTMPLFKAGRTTLFLIAGDAKTEAVRRVLEGGEGPAAAVTARERLAWYLDEAAAAGLQRR